MDFHAQHWLRGKIRTLQYNQRVQLRNVNLCNTLPTSEHTPIFLMSNGKSARFVGQRTCKQSFCCPVCSAHVANKKAKLIAAALDSLKADYYAFMLTLTIPHLRFMSCSETTDILYNTWISAFKGCKARRKCKGKKKPADQFRFLSPINEWFITNNIAYTVRACEFTWSNINGWHPHFHCLIWVPRKYYKSVYDAEEKLRAYWNKKAEEETRKYWQKHQLHLQLNQEGALKRMFTNQRVDHTLFLSRRESSSASYIAGWSSDAEVAKLNYKTAHDGHYTPYQILQKAINGNKEFGDLYIEFCLAVTRKPVHRRFEFSKGLLQVARTHIQTQKAVEYIKKKEDEPEIWHVLTWFSNAEWSLLNQLNSDSPILSNILWLAAHKATLLGDFLAFYGISVSKTEHLLAKYYEDAFNLSA